MGDANARLWALEPWFSAHDIQFTALCKTICGSFQWDRLAFRKPDPRSTMRALVAMVEGVANEGTPWGCPRVPEKLALLWRVRKAVTYGVFLDHARLLHTLHHRLKPQASFQACLPQKPPYRPDLCCPHQACPLGSLLTLYACLSCHLTYHDNQQSLRHIVFADSTRSLSHPSAWLAPAV